MTELPAWRAELTDAGLRDRLDRAHPERVGLRPRDVAGIKSALDLVDEMWAPTIARARSLPADRLHARVDGEYSFVETLRHLVFVGDAWLRRMVLQVPDPFHAWGVPPNLPADAPPDTGPGLEDVVPVREERTARVRAHVERLSEDDLRVRVGGPWDPPDLALEHRARVIDCFRVAFREEWWHHRFAERDLEVASAIRPSSIP